MGCTKNYFNFPVFNPNGHGLMLFGEEQEVFESSEPSNIIWENLEVPQTRRNFNICLTATAMLFILGFICVGTIAAKLVAAAATRQYPISTLCDKIIEGFDTVDQFKLYALNDKENTIRFQGYGVYQCYCKYHSSKMALLDPEDDCHEYQYGTTQTLFLTNVMTVMIVVLNTVLKIINVTFINAIGFSFNSEIVAYMVSGVFVAQFVNVGLMTLLACADFEMTPLSFIPIYNLYSDFTKDWYVDVGK